MNYQPVLNQLKKLSPQAIILFGSQISGTANKDSDLDILLLKETDEPFHKRISEAHRILHTNIPVDILVLTPEEFKTYHQTNSFYKTIFETGYVAYGRI